MNSESIDPETQVILVNEHDEAVGQAEKMEAHVRGLLHRAFSIFIFDSQERWLLQKRADSKYHSPGLWTNACCSHPTPGSDLMSDATCRLEMEMGFTAMLCPLTEFTYRAEFDNGLIENEYDHILVGHSDGPVLPNPDEVSEYRWVTNEQLMEELRSAPEAFTYWFRKAVPLVLASNG